MNRHLPTVARSRKTRGFTLVEMLAATALAALLFVTMLLVVAGLGRERRAAAERAQADVPAEFADLIRWDLQNARSVRRERDEVLLSGFGSLDPDTLAAATLQPVTVVYAVRDMGGQSWLVRRQTWNDDLFRDPLAELVCAGVSALELVPVSTVSDDAPPTGSKEESKPSTRPAAVEEDAGEPVAAHVLLRVRWADEKRPPLERLIVLK